jgi:hypothetical protein
VKTESAEACRKRMEMDARGSGRSCAGRRGSKKCASAENLKLVDGSNGPVCIEYPLMRERITRIRSHECAYQSRYWMLLLRISDFSHVYRFVQLSFSVFLFFPSRTGADFFDGWSRTESTDRMIFTVNRSSFFPFFFLHSFKHFYKATMIFYIVRTDTLHLAILLWIRPFSSIHFRAIDTAI